MELTPAVVTPLDDHMGLDIARSLGKKGIPVYGFDTKSDTSEPGRHSKYCQFVLSPDPEKGDSEDYIQALIDWSKKLGKKSVLFPLSDFHVLLISRHRTELEQYFEFVLPDHDILAKLASKDGLYTVAQKHKIPAADTFINIEPEQIDEIARKISYPAILKPVESTYWHRPEIIALLRRGLTAARAKVILCHTPEELIESYQRVSAIDRRLIIQEVIPGEDSRLVYFCFYVDRNSKPLGIFAGRKLRVIPTGFGSASYVKSFYDPELVELGLSLLEATHYQGLGGIEFKKDPRDDRYKIIEFNTRFGMWDGLSVRCGVDLPYIAYRDALGMPVEPQKSYDCGMIWVDWQRDLRAALSYQRDGQISWGQWLRSYHGKKMWAIYSRDDWKPGVAFSLVLLRKYLQRLVKMAPDTGNRS